MPSHKPFRSALLVASALSGSVLMIPVASGQGILGNGSATPGAPASNNEIQGQSGAVAPNTSSRIETIRVRARRLLLREKDSPSAVTELGTKAIQQTGTQGSIATLLRQAPSVNVYQQGIGNSEPVLSIRGVRGLSVATTLDGVPTQDLLNGGSGSYLTNIIGSKFDLSQISGVSIYPGVAYPDVNTFGTIGGTVAYDSLRPSADPEVDLLGSIGSFHTYEEGVTLNSGKLDGFLGRGDDAPSFLAQYSNLQTAGFVDYTPARYNNFEFAMDKPYDDGLSKFQATVLYNTGSGDYEPEAVPLPYLQQNGMYSNYSPNEEFAHQANQYLTVILKDSTYVNDYVNLGGSIFYERTQSDNTDWGEATAFPITGDTGALTVGGSNPFIQTPAGFGDQSEYAPGGVAHEPPIYSYDGNALFPAGSSQYCPASIGVEYAGQTTPCGYNAERTLLTTDLYGVQPRVTLTLPTYYGAANTIIFGGLIGRETAPNSQNYLWGTPNVPETPGNLIANTLNPGLGSFDGGDYRDIYLAYAQNKLDLLQNTLHITPGLTLEASSSGANGSEEFDGAPSTAVLNSAYCQGNPCEIGAYSADRWDKELLPFVNLTYDLDKVLPLLRGTSLYASYGESSLFPPTNDFGPNTQGGVPGASIVHLYEGGIKYNTSNLVLSTDYFYQKIDRAFGFFQYQSGPLEGDEFYTNNGDQEFKGVEASAIWQINPHWQLFGNMSHTLAKYLATEVSYDTIQEDQFGVAVRGQPISGVPPWIATFGVDYDRHGMFIPHDELHARFEGQFTGPQPITTDVAGDNPNIGPIPGFSPPGTYEYYQAVVGDTVTDQNTNLPSFVIFNLDLNYSLPTKQLGVGYLKALDFDLNILNLFNNHYFAYFYNQVTPGTPTLLKSGPFAGQQAALYSGPEFADGIPGEPFAVTFTTTAKF